jgi:hypothetical protein
MVEVKDYFQDIKDNKRQVLLWIAGSDDSPVAMKTYVEEVFIFEGVLAGLGVTPKLGSGYMEYIPMDQVGKFTIIPEDMMDEFFEKAELLPAGKKPETDNK